MAHPAFNNRHCTCPVKCGDREATKREATLHLVKGKHEYEQQLQSLTAIAWQIAYAALWNGEELPPAEKDQATKLICDFIRSQNNPRNAYAEFVQRVLLARQYIYTHPGSWISMPVEWLGAGNKKGFERTKPWFASMENMRRQLPLYKLHFLAFGEAMRELITSFNARDFHHWRTFFAQRSQQTLNLFLATLANRHL